MDTFSLYGIKFRRLTARKVAHKLTYKLKHGGKPYAVFTPNFTIMQSSRRSPELKSLLGRADMLLPDGVGISLLCRINGLKSVPRITGIDTGYFLLRYCARERIPVYFLGAGYGVAERAAAKLKDLLPTLNICGVHHGYFDKSPRSPENTAVINDIKAASPRLLFVCFGFPAQERWIAENLSQLPTVRLALGLGGSLDVWSGDIRRAPMLFRVLNLEWLWRIGTRGRGDAGTRGREDACRFFEKKRRKKL